VTLIVHVFYGMLFMCECLSSVIVILCAFMYLVNNVDDGDGDRKICMGWE